MKKLLKQFGIFLISCTLTLQLVGPGIVFAEDPATPATAATPAPAAKEDSKKIDTTPTTLDVSKYLIAEGQKNQPKSIAGFIVRFINFMAGVIGTFAFTVIVIGGIMLVTSAGAENQLQRGKDMIKFAIIGLIVALSAYIITAFVQSIFFEYGATAAS